MRRAFLRVEDFSFASKKRVEVHQNFENSVEIRPKIHEILRRDSIFSLFCVEFSICRVESIPILVCVEKIASNIASDARRHKMRPTSAYS